MEVIKAIIIDDESLARDLVRSYLEVDQDIEILGEYSDGFQGLKAINELEPDLVFLDVQMPKLTGFEMLELLDKPCNIVFTTAYNEYAIKAFEHNAIDYLLKPFSNERFQDAVRKVKERISNSVTSGDQIEKIKNHNDSSDELLIRVVVKSRNKIDVIAIDKIKYFEAQDDYVMIYTNEGRYLKQKTMKYFESHLNPNEFCRIHRTYLVKIDQIAQLQPYEKDHWIVILKTGESLNVSRNGFKQLKLQLEI
ncbi:LytTR family transcriptional regulator DNA-binding domain-containing protein [Labilibaculum sp. K2S]|uniref:LytR/AlgR family response regulator transcription factor n=1 Tax=Labilibaculum sp. K2S TaxID=3056386 RepID=UPI0025A38139|nr:LytTR family transcriptional regulator DNA-binding domain-containing protein [Labilibaculum sp. K2S]MDM8158510.1 LytTR family transcriptional regulator DNA-binding domain-containing protein [Labilibaculum sp. K2S]